MEAVSPGEVRHIEIRQQVTRNPSDEKQSAEDELFDPMLSIWIGRTGSNLLVRIDGTFFGQPDISIWGVDRSWLYRDYGHSASYAFTNDEENRATIDDLIGWWNPFHARFVGDSVIRGRDALGIRFEQGLGPVLLCNSDISTTVWLDTETLAPLRVRSTSYSRPAHRTTDVLQEFVLDETVQTDDTPGDLFTFVPPIGVQPTFEQPDLHDVPRAAIYCD